MTYAAKILADSLATNGKRLTTFQITIPKFIQAELNTHRMLSKSSASSRAIPIERVIDQVMNDPVLPVWWGAAQSGMSAAAELAESIPNEYKFSSGIGKHCLPETRFALATSSIEEAKYQWLRARDVAVSYTQKLQLLGLHKQITNRLIEPWMFVDVIVSGTEWDNFFRLRRHAAAQPEFKHVAELMFAAMSSSAPQLFAAPNPLGSGVWHLPFIEEEDEEVAWDITAQECFCHDDPNGEEPCSVEDSLVEILCKVSTARCARTSYQRQNDERPIQKDIELAERLLMDLHMGPFEHVATPLQEPERDGNFVGWHQYRADVDPHWQA